MTATELVEYLRKLPENSQVECLYMFSEQDKPAKGLVVVRDKCIYLKHNNDSYHGSGARLEPYKYSWYICRHSDGSYCLSDVNVLDLLTYTGKILIGEL